ncbi:MAG: dephospho-CoA kinase, partial [Ruminococcus sp.]|nr:dephospho-CoA kinase [Ruminococcus sp.]
MTKPIIVGLTGQSGAGKSTVSMEFMLEDFHVINCDRMTHILLQPGTECSKALQAQVPDFYSDGIFDRRKAAPMLFADKELL